MLTPKQLKTFCLQKNYAPETIKIIEEISSSPPSRTPQGNVGNVVVRYPSRKMGLTVWAESHQVEFAGVLEYEHDPATLAFYDQPPSIPLRYASAKGKTVAVNHTPDYFVIREEGCGWEEWKPKAKLEELSHSQPNRYCRGTDGKWHCPPGEAYAQQFGLTYTVRSSAEINWVWQENTELLADYLSEKTPQIPTSIKTAVLTLVSNNKGITIAQLRAQLIEQHLTEEDPVGVIYTLITQGELAINFKHERLTDDTRTRVFPDSVIAEAYRLSSTQQISIHEVPPLVEIKEGVCFTWDGVLWEIINAGEKQVFLKQKQDPTQTSQVSYVHLQKLVSAGEIKSVLPLPQTESENSGSQLYLKATAKELEIANRRLTIIQSILRGEKPNTLSRERTWVKKYKEAERAYGNGYYGLIPNQSQRGNREPRINSEVAKLMMQHIEEKFETTIQETAKTIYDEFRAVCQERNLEPPSYKTFTQRINSRPRKEQTIRRHGFKAAQNLEPIYLELDHTTPLHGTHPFQIVHIDHTELDVHLIHSETKKYLGRIWLSLMIDAFSRRILAFYVTFDKPSYRSCMMLFRECVRRHNRLPETIVLDGGKEFRGIWFQAFAALYGITLKYRPKAKPRTGSVIERFFKTNDTQFIHTLVGNNQIMKQVRQVTKDIDARNTAVWSLPDLFPYLQKWFYEIYDQKEHGTLGESPREHFERGLASTGHRTHKLIPFTEEFKQTLLPSNPKGTAKVIPGRGIQVNGIYYWHDAFRSGDIEETSVPVKYDPEDLSYTLATIPTARGRRVVKCLSNYAAELKGCSVIELHMITAEQKKHATQTRQRYLEGETALINFKREYRSTELSLQQAKQAELKKCLAQSQEAVNPAELLMPPKPPKNNDKPKPEDLTTYDDY